ncbi:fungal-specific transcription factor domain-containing protein, partial [Mycotypha africana]|uniref:fungal-specific transcription factor domain-containing protein n=1 Tax=Mycotypha africana TaxID=64632 RepID=UPI00230003B7
MPVRKIFEETEKKENNTAQQTQQREQLGHGTEIIANNNNIKAPSQSAPFSSMGNNSDITSFDRFAINEIGQALYINDIKERDDRIPDYHDLQLQQLQSDELSDITADSPISSTASFYVVASQPQSTSTLVPDHLICSRRFIHEVQPLLEVYFDHVHKYLPMIHKPTFLKQLHSNYYGYSSVSSAVSTNHLQPPSKFLVYAMCAVAAKWAPNHLLAEENSDLVVRMRKLTETLPPGYSFYQKAIDLLDEFMDIPRTSTIQGILLLVKYQECFQRTGYFHRSHFYLGIAVQMCHDLGLTLVATSLNCDAEIKRRTFWVAFMMDLLMSIELGQAPYFNIQQCTTAFPMVTNEEGPALEELIVNQNIFIQLGKVLSDIYCTSRRLTLRQQIQGKHKTEEQMVEEQAKLFSLHTHLENFLYEVPPDYYPVEKHPILDPYIGFLHITYHLSVILLHRLYVLNPLSETKFEFIGYPHQQLCATSASNITSIVQTLLETYPSYIFNYPIRGVQHVIHCLTMALSIHKYEMNHAENNSMKNAA